MTLTGALLAVSVQQWAQSYLHATQDRTVPRNRARIRAYYSEGINNWHLPQVTQAVPTLIHVSLILFFSGLPIFLFILHRTVFDVILTWMMLCVLGYAGITLIPILSQDSPYYSPLSSSTWWCVTRTLTLVLWLLESLVPRNSSVLSWYNTYYANSYLGWPSSRSRNMRQVSKLAAFKLRSDIDYRALKWMFRTLNTDEEFEQFFDALPGLSASEVYVDHQDGFIKPINHALSVALVGFMNRTLSSSLVSEDVKQRRIIICSRALQATSFIGPWWILSHVLGDWRRFLECIEFGLFVQNWKNITLPVTKIYAKYVVASIISRVRKREDGWFQLASVHLMMSKSLLQNRYAHDDSILLANIIDIIRQSFESYSESDGSDRDAILDGSTNTLELVCKLNIHNTLTKLQHEFCAIWNQLIDANTTFPHVRPISMMTLKSIRRLYLALHEATFPPVAFSSFTDDGDPILDDAASYPKCTMDLHRPCQTVSKLRLVGRSHSPASAIITTPSMSSVFVSALSSLRTTRHTPTSAAAPSNISSTDHIPQTTHACSGDAPPAMAEPAGQQDLDISRSSPRLTPEVSYRGCIEEPPSPSPSFRSALSVSSTPRDDISSHSDLLEVRIHSPQT